MPLPDDAAMYVLSKPPRLHKGGVYKDGLHLHIPGIVTRPEVQHLLRAAMLPHVAALFGDKCTNSAEDIYDEAVIERNGWLLYGSKKPDEPTPWTVLRVLAPTGEPFVWNPDPLHLVPLLSIRNKYDESPYTAECIEAVKLMVAEKDAAVARRNARDAARATAAPPANCASFQELERA